MTSQSRDSRWPGRVFVLTCLCPGCRRTAQPVGEEGRGEPEEGVQTGYISPSRADRVLWHGVGSATCGSGPGVQCRGSHSGCSVSCDTQTHLLRLPQVRRLRPRERPRLLSFPRELAMALEGEAGVLLRPGQRPQGTAQAPLRLQVRARDRSKVVGCEELREPEKTGPDRGRVWRRGARGLSREELRQSF